MKPDQLILMCAKNLGLIGAERLNEDEQNKREAFECVRALINDPNRPDFDAKGLVLMGLTLGIGLEHSNNECDKLGGIQECAAKLKDGTLEQAVAEAQ